MFHPEGLEEVFVFVSFWRFLCWHQHEVINFGD